MSSRGTVTDKRNNNDLRVSQEKSELEERRRPQQVQHIHDVYLTYYFPIPAARVSEQIRYNSFRKTQKTKTIDDVILIVLVLVKRDTVTESTNNIVQ